MKRISWFVFTVCILGLAAVSFISGNMYSSKQITVHCETRIDRVCGFNTCHEDGWEYLGCETINIDRDCGEAQ